MASFSNTLRCDCVSFATGQVSDATGSMTVTKVSEKSPFAKELLVRDDCFILDNGANGKIFVWKGLCTECSWMSSGRHSVHHVMFQSGNGANAEEKQSALKMADAFIDQMNYPRMKTQVVPSLSAVIIR